MSTTTVPHDAGNIGPPPNPIPLLDPDTLAGLRESIHRFGVLVPIVVDLEGHVLDGRHRLAIATELRVEHPLTVVAPMPTDVIVTADALTAVRKQRTAITKKAMEVISHFDLVAGEAEVIEVAEDADIAEIARTLNVDRRHLTPEQRREFVAELRSQGKSTRAIATATGASQTQVRRDLNTSGEPGGSTGADAPVMNLDPPGKVTGADGKSYPSKAPKPKKPRAPKPRKPSKLEELAEKVRAHNAPGVRREKTRLAAVDLIKIEGWPQFSHLVDELRDEYGTP